MANLSLNIGLTGMRAAQSALEALGHNLANANTPGYSRQRPDLQAGRPIRLAGINIGTGAAVIGMSRVHDGILSRRIVSQLGVAERFRSSLQAMNGVQAILQEPSENGLGAIMDRFFESVAELSNGPEDTVRRLGLSQSAQEFVSQFNQIAEGTEQMRADIVGQVELLAMEVNSIARQVRDLNVQIGKTEAGGSFANDLRDRRDVALEELGQLMDIKYYEGQDGVVTVNVGGQLLSGHSLVQELIVDIDGDGKLQLLTNGGTTPLPVTGGRIGGLVQIHDQFLPGLAERLDQLAYNTAFEVNRLHSTGSIPGGFSRMSGVIALTDADGDGDITDESLASAGLGFSIQSGELNVNVIDEATGSFETHTIDISPSNTSVGALLDSLSEINGLNATLDSQGRVQIHADSGVRFDFSTRLNEAPDPNGVLGGARASLATIGEEPFVLADGMALDITGQVSNFTMTFEAADFDNISAVSASELAAALNQNSDIVANGLRAVTMGGHVALQTVATGLAATFDVTGGTALAALGLAITSVTGHTSSVDVQVHGQYTGAENGEFTFRPLSDGKVGTTPNLQVEVRDQNGSFVAILDVGDTYLPGSEFDLPDGLQVSFTVGDLSATHNDVLVQRLLADGDTSDVLVGLGLNAFFTGSDAQSFEVAQAIIDDPGLIATSSTGASGDNGVMLALQDLRTTTLAGLGVSMGEFYGATISDVGFQIASTETAAATEQLLVDSLHARKEEISGVNIDEELVDMIRFEQQFGATAQFIQVVNQLAETVLSLI